MDCAEIRALTGWTCEPVGKRAFLARTPIELGDGGELINLFVAFPSDETIYVTDAGQSLMHALGRGIKMNRNRVSQINRNGHSEFAKFDENGEVSGSAPLTNAQTLIWDSIKIMLNASFLEESWLPKFHQEKFKAKVLHSLREKIGDERIQTGYRIQGSSGKLLEFPALIKPTGIDDPGTLIQTLGSSDGKIDNSGMYAIFWKFSDVKEAHHNIGRLAIFEETQSKEAKQAISMISRTSTVSTLQQALKKVA